MGDRLEGALHDAFAAAGLPLDLHLVDGERIDETLAGLAPAPAIVVGGGDGTLGRAAGILARTNSALGILPLGTRNHLANQLRIPASIADAAKIIANGHRTRIDLARAGTQTFVNNASVGLYSRLVLARDAVPGPKWLGTIPATWHVLRHLRTDTLRLAIDGVESVLHTPLLFVGNNRYALDHRAIGTRDSLSDGALSFYAVAPKGAVELIAMAVRVLIGRADPHRDFTALTEGRTARIDGAGLLEVALDGEVSRMALPVEFAILPLALDVFVP